MNHENAIWQMTPQNNYVKI